MQQEELSELPCPPPILTLRAHSHVTSEPCSVCFDEVSGDNGPGDLRLACGCCLHYFCLVRHFRAEVGDRQRLLVKLKGVNKARRGILCPNAYPGGKCAFAPSQGGAGTEAGGGGFITLTDLEELLNFHKRINESPQGRAALGAVLVDDERDMVEADELFLTQGEVEKLREWLLIDADDARDGGPLPPVLDDPYLLATTKSCPTGCGGRGTHYQGHHCHHVHSPGCATCGTEYCWSCDSTAEENEQARGSEHKCKCRGKSWSRGCSSLRSTASIARFLVLTPYPHDSRCGCPICPDCREGQPCSLCGSSDGSDWGCAVCSGFINPGPTELDPSWLPQTEAMKMKSANEPEVASDDQYAFFEAVLAGDEEEVRRLVATGQININAFDDEREGEHGLFTAADQGYEQVVACLIELGADVNLPESEMGSTPTLRAAREGHLEVLRLLLAKGGNVDTPDNDGCTPCYAAASENRTECMRLLIEKEADFNSEDREGTSPCLVAAQEGHAEVLSLLLDKGADVNKFNNDGWSPVFAAARSGHTECIRLLLTKAPNIDVDSQETDDGNSPVFVAAYNGFVDILTLLLERGADTNAQSMQGESPLQTAARQGQAACLAVLLEKDAKIDTFDEDGWSPVYSASREGNVECLRLLLDKDADFNTPNSTGKTPVYAAAGKGHSECLALLLTKNVDVNAPDEEGWTPTNKAVVGGHLETVRQLLEHNADVNTPETEMGATPTLIASRDGFEEILGLLLAKGGNIDTPDNDGCTPCYGAASENRTECMRLLIEKGADFNSEDREGTSPCLVAAQEGHAEVLSLLLDKGADVNKFNNDGWSPVFAAARSGHTECIRLLLTKAPNIDVDSQETDDGNSPVFVAARYGHAEILQQLIDKGANVNTPNKAGKCPLTKAVEKKEMRCVELLLQAGAIDENEKAKKWLEDCESR